MSDTRRQDLDALIAREAPITSTRTRRYLIARCVREAVLVSLMGDFPPERVPLYKQDLQEAITSDIAREVRMSTCQDYPAAQAYLKIGGRKLRERALRALTGAGTNPTLS